MRCVAILAALLAICAPGVSSAQTSTATLSGVVVDESRAALPDTVIVLVQEGTGLRRETRANAEGRFTYPFLPPGRYSIVASRAGFTASELAGLTLQVGDQLLVTVRLGIAPVKESLTVAGDVPQVETSAAVSTIVDRKMVDSLPMNGRSFQSLIILTPGVVLTKTTFGAEGQFSVNGQRANANYFTVDGVSGNVQVSVSATLNQTAGGSVPTVSATGGSSVLVGIDALQEFRINTSTYAPEFGRTPGAQVSIVTRSGTNRFSGTAFEYFRDDAMDANDFFANRNHLPKPPIRQHDFGGVIGGPLFRDRTFFFASQESLRLDQPQTKVTEVPSLDTRQAAVPQVQPFLRAYPVPNGPPTGGGRAQFAATYSDPSSSNAFSLRIDHALSRSVNLFGRYNYAPSESQTRAIDNTTVNTITAQRFRTQTATFGATMTLGPRTSNDLRVNWSGSRATWFSWLDDFGGASPPAAATFFPPSADPANSLVVFSIGGNYSGFYVGKNVSNEQRQVNIVDTLTHVAGAHQLKAGVDYRRLTPALGIRSYGQFVGFADAAVLARGKTTTLGLENWDPAPLLFNNLSLFAQDSWTANSRLTLTYGLRWDLNPAPAPRNGKQLYAIVGLDDLATATVAPGRLYRTRYTNFAPRVGIAYVLSNKPGREVVVRGGAGVFYDLGNGPAGNIAGTFPNSIRSNTTVHDYPLTAAEAAAPALRTTVPVGGLGFRAFEPNLEVPRVYQWNLSLERALGPKQSIQASYLGAVGRRLLRMELVQSPNANFGGNVNLTRNSATSDYRALQVQFQRRLSSGLQAMAAYTLGKSTDIASNDQSSAVRIDRVDVKTDRGPSDFDVRHALSAALTYTLPTPGRGRVAKAILRDWSIDAMILARSSTPVTVTTGVANLYGAQPRPNLVPGVPRYIDNPSLPGGWQYNPAAFAPPASGQQGTLGRNTLKSFPMWQVDMALGRHFPLAPRFRLQCRMEVFNVLNHPNFGDPSNRLNSGLFGQATQMLGRTLSPGGGAGFSPLYQIGGPRSVQLALRLQF